MRAGFAGADDERFGLGGLRDETRGHYQHYPQTCAVESNRFNHTFPRKFPQTSKMKIAADLFCGNSLD
jgi:hypothetical protein